MARSPRAWAWVLALLLTTRALVAAAEPAGDAQARARAYYEAGRGFYGVGSYAEAIRQFAAGHALVPRPEFLLNMAQCYRKLHDLEGTREMFRRYLRASRPGDPERAQVEAMVAELDRELGATPAPPSTGQQAPGSQAQESRAHGPQAPTGQAPSRTAPSSPQTLPSQAAPSSPQTPPPTGKPMLPTLQPTLPTQTMTATPPLTTTRPTVTTMPSTQPAPSPTPAPSRRSFARRAWWIFPVAGVVAAAVAVGVYFGVRGSALDCGSFGCDDLRHAR